MRSKAGTSGHPGHHLLCSAIPQEGLATLLPCMKDIGQCHRFGDWHFAGSKKYIWRRSSSLNYLGLELLPGDPTRRFGPRLVVTALLHPLKLSC
jgi:hypothetical protein